MVILGWVLFGFILGFFARWYVPGKGRGLLADIVAGSLGAVIGGVIYALAGGRTETIDLPGMVCAMIGAIVLLWVLRALRGRPAV
jgi:uncharacterized membrane protein YeaQ/YmgE (transglycosylase-associated protein family)